MNDCEKYTELMSQMIDGELNAEQESELRTHIASCEECRRVFEAFEGVSSALADELVEPPEMLAKGVMFKLRNQKKHRRFLYGKFTAMAACLALVLFGAAKFGFFGGDLQNISLSNPAGSSAAYGAAQSVDGAGTSTGSTAKTGGKVSREQLKKGVKLKKTDDGTIYQLGFPIQNVQLLEGAKPEEVAKEPARLLDAKLVEIYDGTWYSDAELAEKNSAQTDTRTEIKNDRIATVMDAETLDRIDALLTAVPDATTELTIENRDFTNSDPVCTIYLPADKADESTAPAASGDTADGNDRTAVSDGGDGRTNAFRESLESVKNSILNKSDDTKASPAPSPDVSGSTDKTESKPKQQHDLKISVYYSGGEIWCVVERADTESDTDVKKTAAGDVESDKTAQTAKPAETAQPSPSSSPAAGENTAGTGVGRPFDRILYRAIGTPDKLNALLKELRDKGDVMLKSP